MLQPTIFIALGGTGTKVVYNLRKRFLLEFGTENPENVQYLYVDTDPVNNPACKDFPEAFISLDVNDSIKHDCTVPGSETAQKLHMEEWFDPELKDRMTAQIFKQGVSGIRMFGRLALLATYNFQNLINSINAGFRALYTNQQYPRIFVIASAGGGTGSGIFIDMGYLLQYTIRRNFGQSGYALDGYVAIAVPSMALGEHRRNSAALLTELDYFCASQNIFTACYPGNVTLPQEFGKGAPYNYIFLVSPTQGAEALDRTNPARAMERLEQKLADGLFIRALGQSTQERTAQFTLESGEINSRIIDVGRNIDEVPADLDGYPNQYFTMGLGLYHFPVGLCARVGKATRFKACMEEWLKALDPEPLSDGELRHDIALGRQYQGDLQDLFGKLGLFGSPAPHPPERDALYGELTRVAADSVRLDLAISARLPEGRDRVEDLFQSSGGGVSINTPGFITGTIQQNLRRLLNTHDRESLPASVEDALWNITFDAARGPRYALRLVNELIAQLDNERNTIKEIQEDGGGTPASSGRASNSELVQQDGLLLFWRESAAERCNSENTSGLGAYAEGRLERALLTAKDAIYVKLRNELLTSLDADLPARRASGASSESVNMKARLERLIKFILLRMNSVDKDLASTRVLVNNLPEGTLWPQELIEDKWLALVPRLEREAFAPLARVAMSDSFVNDLPRGEGGNTDLSAFTAIEETIEQALARRDVDPADSIYGDSVIRLLSQQHNGDLAGVASELTKESIPLLNLNLGHQRYESLVTSFLNPSFLWYFVANSTIDPTTFADLSEKIARERESQLRQSFFQGPGTPQTLPALAGHLAATVCMRGAFPSRIITQYEPGDRLNLLYPTGDEAVFTTPFTQSTIQLPIAPEMLDTASRALLLAEILLRGADVSEEQAYITWSNAEQHLLYYPVRDSARRRGQVLLPTGDFTRAAICLARDTKAMASLDDAFHEINRDVNNHGRYKEKLVTVVRGLETLLEKGEKRGDCHAIDMANVNYEDAIEQIETAALEWLGIEFGNLTWAEFDEDNSVWRCKRCGKQLGTGKPRPRKSCTKPGCPNYAPSSSRV